MEVSILKCMHACLSFTDAGNVLGDAVEGALDSAAEPVLDNVMGVLDSESLDIFLSICDTAA